MGMQSLFATYHTGQRTLNARFKFAYLCKDTRDDSQMVFMFSKDGGGASDLKEEYRLLQALAGKGVPVPDTSVGDEALNNDVGGPWLKQRFISGVHHKLEDLVNLSEGQIMQIVDGEVFGEASVAFGLNRRPVGALTRLQKAKLTNFVDALEQFRTRDRRWWGDAQFIIDDTGVPHFMDPLDTRGGGADAQRLADSNLANLDHLKNTARTLLDKQNGQGRRPRAPVMEVFDEGNKSDEDD